MHLRDHMDDATAGTTADLDRLARHSRQRGMKLRRYRQALSAVGVATAVAAALSVGYLATGRSAPGTEQASAPSAAGSTTPSASSDSGAATVPLTGRGTVAALRAAVGELAQGTYGGYAGQEGHDTYGELEFTPADASGVGVVGINVQHGSILDGSPFSCGESWMVDCTVRTLPNGDRIRTYQDQPVPTSEGDGIRVVAELLTGDRSLRVVAVATNGFDLPSNQWDVTRPEPVLTVAQLSQIVSQPWWDFSIPREYEEAGDTLSPYTDFDAEGSGPSPTPSPESE